MDDNKFQITKELLLEYQKIGQNYIDNVTKKKYCLSNEKSLTDVIYRLMSVLKDKLSIDEYNYILNMFLDTRALPAGSILFGLGNTERKCSLSNCYCIPIENDSIESIYECCKKLARTFSMRGGCGTDVTVLRPKDSITNNSALTSTGAVSFIPTFNDVATTIGQNGRRSALLVSLDVRHPDVLDFIWAKAKPEKVFGIDSITGKTKELSECNISVKLTDEFMNAVRKDLDFDLIFPDFEICKDVYDNEWDGNFDKWISKGYPIKTYKTYKAKDILKQISEASWLTGDPGVAFWDTVIKWSPTSFDSKLIPFFMNPCGEQVLAIWLNCLLSSLCFYKYVINPYTSNAEFDTELFETDLKYLIIFLDTLIDINTHPLKEQTEADLYGRRIGIGFTGLADMLAMLGIEYGSEEAINYIDDLLYNKYVIELNTSIELAKDKGCAPCFETKKSRIAFIKQPHIQKTLDKMLPIRREVVENNIKQYGLRNSALNTVAPNGSLSILFDNCSSGMEPVFDVLYERNGRINEKVLIFHYPILKYGKLNETNITKDELKKKFNYKTAYDINYKDRLRMQATVQKWTDASVSSTVNLPNNSTIEDIYNIYKEAHSLGIKGITVFRDGSKGSILSSANNTTSDIDELTVKHSEIRKVITDFLPKIKKQLRERHRGYRDIVKWKAEDVYINIVLGKDDHPMELFAKVPEEIAIINGEYDSGVYNEYLSYWDTICRLVSMGLRVGVPVDVIIKQLDKGSKQLGSIPSVIARQLKTITVNHINTELLQTEIKAGTKQGNYCYECKQNGIIYDNGCTKCILCGWSKCG